MNLSGNNYYIEYLEYWLKVYKKPFLAKSSYCSLLRTIRNDIPLSVKNTKLKDLNVSLIDKAISNVKKSRSRKYTYHVYYNSLKRAFCLGLINENIAERLYNVKHKCKKRRSLTKTDEQIFLESIKGTKYENHFLFYLYSGVRRSEMVKIRIKDIYYLDNLIRIRGTKTENSDRFIPLTDKLKEIIERQKPYAKYGFLFKVHPDTLTQWFKKYSKDYCLHELRHTFITRCAQSGVHVKATQKICGHKSIITTLKIYTTVDEDFLIEELKKLKI